MIVWLYSENDIMWDYGYTDEKSIQDLAIMQESLPIMAVYLADFNWLKYINIEAFHCDLK